jgi:hypothetical protein
MFNNPEESSARPRKPTHNISAFIQALEHPLHEAISVQLEVQAAGIYCPGALSNWTFGVGRKFRIWLLVNPTFYLYGRLMLKL